MHEVDAPGHCIETQLYRHLNLPAIAQTNEIIPLGDGRTKSRTPGDLLYGHRPWEDAYEDKERDRWETQTLYRFQAEWLGMVGRKYRGRTHRFGKGDQDEEEWEESYQHALADDAKYRTA